MDNIVNDIEVQPIKSPEGVALLMENLWLRHKAGIKQRANNVFRWSYPLLLKKKNPLLDTLRQMMSFLKMKKISMEVGYSKSYKARQLYG